MNPENNPSETTVEPAGETPVASVEAILLSFFDMEKVLSQTLVNLARSAPKNPILHGHLMCLFGRLPPPEVETYQQLRDWVETTNHQPLCTPANRCYLSDQAKATNRGSGVVRNPIIFHVNATREVREDGHCSYSRTFNSSIRAGITQDYLIGLIEGGNSVADINHAILQMVESDFDEYDPEDGDYGEDDYNNFEADDSEYGDIEIHRPGTIERSVEDFIRSNYNEEEVREIIDR